MASSMTRSSIKFSWGPAPPLQVGWITKTSQSRTDSLMTTFTSPQLKRSTVASLKPTPIWAAMSRANCGCALPEKIRSGPWFMPPEGSEARSFGGEDVRIVAKDLAGAASACDGGPRPSARAAAPPAAAAAAAGGAAALALGRGPPSQAEAAPARSFATIRTSSPPKLLASDPSGGMNHGPLRIFSGNAHPQLARDIAAQMGVGLSDATVERFNCGEVNVVINESVRDCDVFVIQPTCNGGAGPQENLMELLVMLDAIRRGAANRVTAVMPLYGYARQSSKEKSRSPITARLVTDLLQVAGAHRVLTVELHVSQIQGFASYPIDNMYALPLLAEKIEREMEVRGIQPDDLVVVSPDVGGAKRASAFAHKLHAPLAIFSRQRRRMAEASEVDLVGEVNGKTCIVIDDIADSCETLCYAAEKLKARGAKAVIGAVVHGVFSDPACENIMRSEMECVLVTDTIPMQDKLERCPKLRVVSVAPLLAAAIGRIHSSSSLSVLFEQLPTEVIGSE
mmetsp:Transcript_14597/g.41312  ORF Transcript_14597/g.41312 Transcript_14597/m.41312 type:complete len:509 (+) Transcript_14597:847-2373(+)